MFLVFICLLGMLSPNKACAESRVRRVQVQSDQIVTVRTAIGVATIIQVPDRPNSIVVGDQSAFKVEYLDQAITIKPIRPGAKSNLYIYTDYRRFNVQLSTNQESTADYVVYLENPKEKPMGSTINWMAHRTQLKNGSLTLATKRVAKTRDGVLLVEFEVRSEKSETFQPQWLWLTQESVTRPIHGIAISGQALEAGQGIQGVMQIMKSDVSDKTPMRLEFRRAKTSSLVIPKVTSWK